MGEGRRERAECETFFFFLGFLGPQLVKRLLDEGGIKFGCGYVCERERKREGGKP